MKIQKLPVAALFLATMLPLANVNAQKTDSLKEKKIDEVVVVGYGTQQKRKISGAVTEVKLDKINSRSFNTAGEALQGKVSGVTVINEGGDPTSAPRINIRGLGGINGDAPLCVIDGIIGDISSVNPNDIESISVLKDATAAIYGARSSGGVVLITTKKGKSGQVKLNIDAKYGFQTAWKTLKPLSAAEYQSVMTQAYQNVGNMGTPPDVFNPTLYPQGAITRTEWMKEIFRTGDIKEYSFDVSQGGDRGNFFVSGDYRESEGTLINTFNKRYNFRVNSNFKVQDWLKIGENIAYTYSNGQTANTTHDQYGAILEALYFPPSIPLFDANGNFSGLPDGTVNQYGALRNPYAQLMRITGTWPSHQLLINPYVEINLLKGLTFKSNFGATLTYNSSKNFEKRITEAGKPDPNNYLTVTNDNGYAMLAEQTLNYKRTLGAHTIDALAGFSFQKDSWKGSYIRMKDFESEVDYNQFLGNGELDTSNPPYDYEKATALQSGFARLNYDYAGKYLLSLTGRRDSASQLAKEHRTKNYGSVSLGWVVTKEDFLNDISWLNLLKIRGSYGTQGNLSSIPAGAASPNMVKTIAFQTADGKANTGYAQVNMANPLLTWGEVLQKDLGADLSLFGNKLGIQFDYFERDNKQMIFEKPLFLVEGITYVNRGLVQDKGFELGLNWDQRTDSGLHYNIYANLSKLNSKIASMGDLEGMPLKNNVRDVLKPLYYRVGDPLFSFYGYKIGGIFASDAEAAAYVDDKGNKILPDAGMGDFKFLRKDGNTGQLTADDKVYLGSPYPDLTYSFGINLDYKAFDFNVFFQGTHGNKIFNGMKYASMKPGNGKDNYNLDSQVLNAWTPKNTGSMIPMLKYGDPANNFGTESSFYVEDGSYLRLKNLTIGYTLPLDAMNIKYLNKVRVYATANNLLTFTKYTGMDPEIGLSNGGIDMGKYPNSRSFVFGVTLGL